MRSYKLDEFVAHGSRVNCLRIGRNTARVLVTGGKDKKVNLWQIGQPDLYLSLSGLQSAVDSVTFDGAEHQVAAGGASGAIKVWDLESGRESRTLTGHHSNCLTLEFHPVRPFISTGSSDTSVKVWDLRRRDAVTTFQSHTTGVKKLAISPDGKWVCSGSENGEIKLWDMHSGRVVKDGWCHDDAVTGIEFHPAEFILATSSTDTTVKIWDLEVFQSLDTLGPEATAVKAIAYHKDGKQLLTATADALNVWGVEPAVHHDRVPMDWQQLADMHWSYKEDEVPRVVACCIDQAAVCVFLVDLQKVEPFCGTRRSLPAQPPAIGAGGSRQKQQQQPSHMQPIPQRSGIGSRKRPRHEQQEERFPVKQESLLEPLSGWAGEPADAGQAGRMAPAAAAVTTAARSSSSLLDRAPPPLPSVGHQAGQQQQPGLVQTPAQQQHQQQFPSGMQQQQLVGVTSHFHQQPYAVAGGFGPMVNPFMHQAGMAPDARMGVMRPVNHMGMMGPPLGMMGPPVGMMGMAMGAMGQHGMMAMPMGVMGQQGMPFPVGMPVGMLNPAPMFGTPMPPPTALMMGQMAGTAAQTGGQMPAMHGMGFGTAAAVHSTAPPHQGHVRPQAR